MGGQESDEHGTQYVHSAPPTHTAGFFLGCFSFPSPFFVLSLILFYPPIFIIGHFCCCYGVVFLDAGAFNGDLSAWDVGEVTTMGIST